MTQVGGSMTWEEEDKKFKAWIVAIGLVGLVVVALALVASASRDRANAFYTKLYRNVEKNQVSESQPERRFEKLFTEDDGMQFDVWHDREAGTEIVCARGYDNARTSVQPNCWTTGRQWK